MPDQNSGERLVVGESDPSTMSEETARLTPSSAQSYGSNTTREAESGEPAGANTTNESPNNQGEPGEEQSAAPYDEAVEDVVTSLARRVRCLFSVITWPIVPLGTTASLALVWLIYASAVLDVGKTCSHPLHAYSILSLVLVLYAPYHGRIRSFLFNYQRERGSERPPSVRRYDQLFHTLALIYVYAGITLVQTCRDDISVLSPDADDSGTGDASSSALTNVSLSSQPANTCAATCPNLFLALRVYVATIEIFTFSLILPLLFLPCLYLYFIRRTMQDAESLAVLQDRFREEEALMRNGGVTEQEIMDQFEKVRLVVDPSSTPERRVVVVPDENQGGSRLDTCDECRSKECCICMESFAVQEDEEAAACDDEALQIIRTRTCGHLFHQSCMGSWVSGRWQNSSHNSDGNSNSGTREPHRRARRTTCPLCRRDVRPNR
ncbi:hypothetical protein ACA910_014464 [Epithemia clementina (nom. ined.)]